MPIVRISPELHATLKENEELIKADFLTIKMFVDSAIRTGLRTRGVRVGEDEIIAHLQKLKESKSRHLNRQALSRKKLSHKKRVARQEKRLDEKVGE